MTFSHARSLLATRTLTRVGKKLAPLLFPFAAAHGCGGSVGQPCPVEDASLFPCHYSRAIDVTSHGPQCSTFTVPDEQPCRNGVGICHAGMCLPDTAPVCTNVAIDIPPIDVCDEGGECDDGNPCTEDACSVPGLDSCHHVPMADGSQCGDKTCLHGACCAPAIPCVMNDDCKPTEGCTIGACAVNGRCVFVRSDVGDACTTFDGLAGFCEVPYTFGVPRCVKSSSQPTP